MVHDLRTILDGWEYEPGKISVRKIIGRDGREKVQTRVDLGVVQCEISGRPDGQRPFGCESLVDYQESRLRKHTEAQGVDDGFLLTADECRELRNEAHLYYQRYIALFVLGEFAGVVRDTAHNLRMLALCERYAESEVDREAVKTQRAYVLMMHYRGRVYDALNRGRFEDALRLADEGLARLADSVNEIAFDPPEPPERGVLERLRQEVIEKMPTDSPARLQLELQQAIDCEDYERAAWLRDQLTARNGLTAVTRPAR